MQTKTINLFGNDYSVAPIHTGDAKALGIGTGESDDIAFVAASLKAAADPNGTPEAVANLPFYGVYLPLLNAALEVNGLKRAAGEAQAAPAASTGDTSTGQ